MQQRSRHMSLAALAVLIIAALVLSACTAVAPAGAAPRRCC